ncbi:pif1, partial [Symbiodinium sp. CCMP2456]
FLPVTYAYATTVRRAQGATLACVALVFDTKIPDRGYAYVGASRARRHDDVFLLGRIRTTDWLPVGGQADPSEHRKIGPLSESTNSEDSAMPSTPDESSQDYMHDISSNDFEETDMDEPSSQDFAFLALEEADLDDPSSQDFSSFGTG